MRIQELHLKAYGSFSDRSLDLSQGSEGLHVIFGPNEAGKSTALRALRSLLYGIDERTKDTFLHESDRLRIGGRLRSASGQEIAFVRRKGRKNTLLAMDGERLIDEAALNPFLAGVSEELFSSLFGIDHQELVEGGDQILQQKGDVGQALFSAALGSQRFYAVLRELEAEAAGLYRPHASKFPVNRGLADVAAAKREMKEASLAVREWLSHQKTLEELTAQLETVKSSLGRWLKEQSTVARLQRMLPMLARRRGLLEQIGSLGPLQELASDFGSRRRTLANKLVAAEEAALADQVTLEQVQKDHKSLPPPASVLMETAAIEAAVEEVGSHKKSLRDRPANEGKRQQAKNDARDILKGLRSDLTLDQVDALRPQILPAKRQIQDLIAQHQALEVTERKVRKAHSDLELQARKLAEELGTLPKSRNVDPLRRAVADTRRSGDLDRQVSDSLKAVARLSSDCEAGLRSLGLWSGTLPEFSALSLPLEKTIDRMEGELQDAQDKLKTLRQEHRQLALEVKKLEQAVGAMQAVGAIPTEDQLLGTRSRRDEGWRLVKEAWSSRADIAIQVIEFDPERTLSEAYEASVVGADDVADRLRREAERVASYAHQVARRDQMAADIAELDRKIAAAEVSEQQVREAWAAAWASAGIVPLSPREMRAWLDRARGLRMGMTQLAEVQETSQGLVDARKEHRADLVERLRELEVAPVPTGDELAPVLRIADDTLVAHEAADGKRKEHDRICAETRTAAGELDRAIADLNAWKVEWGAAVQSLGLQADVRPGLVQALIEGYSDLFAKLDEEASYRRRIYGIDEDIKEFETSVRSLVGRVAPELEDSDVVRCVGQMSDLLKQATADEARRVALEQQERELRRKLQLTETKRLKAVEGLQALCREAGCESPDQLDDAERRSAEYCRLRGQLAELESAIVEAGDGGSLQALLQEAEGVNPDDLPSRLDRAGHEAGVLEQERARLLEARGAEENELRRMTGGSAAAEAAEKVQEELASLRGHVEHHLRLRVAATLLRKEVERYREANQGPLLLRAGELFKALTLGSFHRVRTEVGPDDEPRLVGVRADGKVVSVDGMSGGSLDQLYLVLRLAALERFMEHTEPMPFVVDDILVNFDDERAKAAMEVLLEFSRTTQVLLFTHHSRVREMAEALSSREGVFVHALP